MAHPGACCSQVLGQISFASLEVLIASEAKVMRTKAKEWNVVRIICLYPRDIKYFLSGFA
jgi:hypothetical protein